MISQASYQRLRCSSVVITQHSFDLETFTYYVISLLCQKHQKIRRNQRIVTKFRNGITTIDLQVGIISTEKYDFI